VRIDVSLRGDSEIEQALAGLVPKLEQRVLRQALSRAIRPILQTARANVLALRVTGVATEPLARGLRLVSQSRKGRLRVSIQTPTRRELVAQTIRRASRRGGQLGFGTRVSSALSSRGYYPAHIELGTKRTPAHPYLRSALEQHRSRTAAQLKTEILQALEREARRG
jgi:hypothetical protein